MTLDEAIAHALTLPDTELSTSYGAPAVKVASNGRAFVMTGHEQETSFVLAIDLDTVEMLKETDPATFWQSPHYEGWPAVLVRFDSPDPERVRATIEAARDWNAARKPVRPRQREGVSRFTRFAAIDWSGAKGSRHRGIAIGECAAGRGAPWLVEPPGGGAWSRAGVLDWLVARAGEPILVGFDFSFAAPFVARGAHLPGETSTASARALWAYVDAACDDDDLGAVSFVEARRGRHFWCGAVDGRKADFLHWRTCEVREGQAKLSTVFDALGAAQVAKASWAGMRLLHRLGGRVPIWPFDPLPSGGAVVVEIYTSIAARAAGLRKGISKLRSAEALATALAALGGDAPAALTRHDDHATDAILAAAWLRASAGRADLWRPARLTADIARTEGWTFGVP